MVYLTKSQRDSRALFLALPCRNCGCGIRARDDAFKREADEQGKDTHYKKTTCDDLKAEREAEQAGAAAAAAGAAAAPAAAAAAARQQQPRQRRRRRLVESGACVGLENVAPAQAPQQQEQAQAQEQEQLKAAHAAEVKQLQNALRQYGACVQLIFIVSLTLSRSLCLALQDCKRARERAHQPERTAGPGFTREGAAGGREEPAQHSTWRGVRTNL